MKLLIFLFSFAAIVAFGGIIVAPQLREYMEGSLEAKAKTAIEASTYYSVTDIDIDHFHAKEVHVVSQEPVTNAQKVAAKAKILSIIEPIKGINAQDCIVVLEKADPIVVASKVASTEKVVSKHQSDEEIDKAVPPPSEVVVPGIDKEPAYFSITWKANEKELFLKGKQTDQYAGTRLKNLFEGPRNPNKVTSDIKIDKENVANSKYLKRTLSRIELLVSNTEGDLYVEFLDAYKASEGQKEGFLKFKGTAPDLAKYNDLTSGMKVLENDDFEVLNELRFYPYVSIEKNGKDKKIILTGTVKDKIDQAMLGSNAARDVTSDYTSENKLVPHPRCLDLAWHDEFAEKLIAEHMSRMVEGKIVYSKSELSALSGVSHDKAYVDEMKATFKGSDVADNVIYEEPKKQIDLVESGPSKPETLAEQLDEYKIYFGSGKSTVDPRYAYQLDEITKKIKASSDQESKIIVGGYADTSGSAEQNRLLSLKRARAVTDQLVSKGVDGSRVQVQFFGAEPNGKTKAESRRVEIKVEKK